MPPAPGTPTAAATEADAVAAAVLACPAVASLHAGGLRQVATYLPGRRVPGVRLGDGVLEVAVVAAYGIPVSDLDSQVRSALAPYAGGRAVDVHVADVRTPQDQLDDAPQLALPTGPA